MTGKRTESEAAVGANKWLRSDLQTFKGIKIMRKIKIKKSTLHRVNEIRVKRGALYRYSPDRSEARGRVLNG